MKIKFNQLAVSIAALTMAGFCFADTDTANLTVNATVVNGCAIGTGTLSFGTLDLAVNGGAGTRSTVDKDASTTVSAVCTNGASAAVTGDVGANAVGSVRKMISSANDLLTYELYTSSARTTVLNATTGSIGYTGTGSATNVDIFGRVAAADIVSAKKGSYADTVALTITYTP